MSTRADYDTFQDESARIGEIIYLAGAVGDYAVSDGLRELLEEEDETLEELFGPLPDWLKTELDERDGSDAFIHWMVRANKFGFVLRFETPIFKWNDDGASSTYSWGWYRTKWVYGDTFDDATLAGFRWVESVRAEEKAALNEPQP